jgi:N-acetylmuramoyl-L-alanine amidase
VHRSLRSSARRVAAAGAAAAIALTLFNAVQPSLGTRRVHPGTVKDVPLTLTAAAAGPVAIAAAGAAAKPASTIAEPRATRPAAAAKPAAARAAVSQSIPVGKARFVGFSWPNPDAAGQGAAASGAGRVWLRTRTAAGWSVAWSELETVAEGPDATSPEYHPEQTYTDGLWLPAGTKEVQVRVDGAAGGPGTDDLAAHLVTPDMTPTPTGDAGGPSQAVAMTSQPAIISRARWGADERVRRAAPSYSGTVKAAFVHHTVQSNGYSPSESAALVRADYLYHVRKRGWNDIGYNFLVDRFGRVFEGRYGGVTRPVLGAHAGGFNTDTTGVAMLGTFSNRRPPAAMRAAMQRLLAWKLDLTHVDPRGQVTLTAAAARTCATRPGGGCGSPPSSGTTRPPTPTALADRRSRCCPPSARSSPAPGCPRSTAAPPAGRGSPPGGAAP